MKNLTTPKLIDNATLINATKENVKVNTILKKVPRNKGKEGFTAVVLEIQEDRLTKYLVKILGQYQTNEKNETVPMTSTIDELELKYLSIVS